MSDAKWYVVHTYSGYENKVKANIDKTIENRHLEDQILEVRVPMQEVVELKNGVQKASQKKMFPGYVLGIKQEDIVVDFEVGDTVTVLSGAWEGTVGMIQAINEQKQSLSINVELFGRETPVELNFSEVRKMD